MQLLTNADPEELAQNLQYMQVWARDLMASRPPDVIIGDGDGADYMHRWFVMPRNVFGGVYLHRFLRSDKDVPHDHPWDSTSVLIEGQYDEQLYDQDWLIETVTRKAGDVNSRRAEDAHRVVLTDGPATSLFFMGPRRRQWGFHCPQGVGTMGPIRRCP